MMRVLCQICTFQVFMTKTIYPIRQFLNDYLHYSHFLLNRETSTLKRNCFYFKLLSYLMTTERWSRCLCYWVMVKKWLVMDPVLNFGFGEIFRFLSYYIFGHYSKWSMQNFWKIMKKGKNLAGKKEKPI